MKNRKAKLNNARFELNQRNKQIRKLKERLEYALSDNRCLYEDKFCEKIITVRRNTKPNK